MCEPTSGSGHVFGFLAVANGSFSAVQDAVQSWNSGKCLEGFSKTTAFLALVLSTTGVQSNSTIGPGTNTTFSGVSKRYLASRADCPTIDVVNEDTCDMLAARYGIAREDFYKHNPIKNLCPGLQESQRVCCGPQKPNTPKQKAGTDLSQLNPCPLNTCCSIHGYYGTTAEFCTIAKEGEKKVCLSKTAAWS